MVKKDKIICVVGTTASGKSDIGVELALKFGGEIISADCRQVFKGLDLGSGKITPEETKGVPHHLLDIREPNEFFSMANFQELAYEKIEEILARKNVPFIVGGTGLYVDSVADGYILSGHAPDLEYRNYLETFETPKLYEMLMEKMPDSDVDPHNRNRVMRLLERIQSGDDITPRQEARYDVLRLGVTWPRPVLCERIDIRLKKRMEMGMVDEVKRLMENGATPLFLDKLGLEYRWVYRYLSGQVASEEEMLVELSRAIKRFAKWQMIWFRKNKSIVWLDMEGDFMGQAERAIEEFLKD